MDVRDLEQVLEVADVIQLGARNMQNYTLLTELGRGGRPVLLKRGLSATLEELLMSAEYILKEGNDQVMLCERGIRTYEPGYRFTLDLMAVPVLKRADPPAGRGRPEPRGRPARRWCSRCRSPPRRRVRTPSSSRSTPPRGGDLRRPAGDARGRVRRLHAPARAGAELAGKPAGRGCG